MLISPMSSSFRWVVQFTPSGTVRIANSNPGWNSLLLKCYPNSRNFWRITGKSLLFNGKIYGFRLRSSQQNRSNDSMTKKNNDQQPQHWVVGSCQQQTVIQVGARWDSPNGIVLDSLQICIMGSDGWPTPLKNMSQLRLLLPTEWKVIKAMLQTTN